MAIDFPNSPSTNDQYTVGTTTWMYNGTAWVVSLSDASIATGAITADKIASNAVTTAKILDANVTAGKIASGAAVSNIGYTPANIASPTFTGTVVLPSTTSIGTVTSTEIGYVDGVTSAIQTQLDSKLTATTATTSGRNLLINGDFKVWQRGSARTYMNPGSYLADRWTIHLYQNGGHERVAGRATQYAIRVSSSSTAENSGGTRMWLTQKVESLNSYRLRSQQVTLSFWIRFSAATCSSSTATAYGNFSGTIGYYTSTTDSATGNTSENTGTSVTLTNGSLPTTWTKYSVTGTCPSDLNNIHASFGFGGLGNTAANSGVWYEVAEVQLEVGTVATPFEFEDYGATLAKCQRYYQERNNFFRSQAIGGQYQASPLSTTVPMRTAPTVTLKTASGRSATYVGALIPTTTVNGARLDNYATAAGVDYYCDDLYQLVSEL